MFFQFLKEADQEQLLRWYHQESLYVESGCMYFSQSFTARVSMEFGIFLNMLLSGFVIKGP